MKVICVFYEQIGMADQTTPSPTEIVTQIPIRSLIHSCVIISYLNSYTSLVYYLA